MSEEQADHKAAEAAGSVFDGERGTGMYMLASGIIVERRVRDGATETYTHRRPTEGTRTTSELNAHLDALQATAHRIGGLIRKQ